MSMNALKLIELTLVIACLVTSVICFVRLFIHTLRSNGLSRRFRERLAVVDPEASKSIFDIWGIKDRDLNDSLSMARYIQDKGRSADPTLVELEKAYNTPFKKGMLTLVLIPGGFVAAVLVIVIFKAVFNLS